VAEELQFALFQDDERGPLWRAPFTDLDEAKRQAQRFADDEGHEFFVYSFKSYTEVMRVFPSKRRSSPGKGRDLNRLETKEMIS